MKLSLVERGLISLKLNYVLVIQRIALGLNHFAETHPSSPVRFRHLLLSISVALLNKNESILNQVSVALGRPASPVSDSRTEINEAKLISNIERLLSANTDEEFDEAFALLEEVQITLKADHQY